MAMVMKFYCKKFISFYTKYNKINYIKVFLIKPCHIRKYKVSKSHDREVKPEPLHTLHTYDTGTDNQDLETLILSFLPRCLDCKSLTLYGVQRSFLNLAIVIRWIVNKFFLIRAWHIIKI